jgi:hypothetical protein
VVDLAGTSIDDLVVPVLARMPSIELLDLRRTNVTGRAIEKLRRSLPGCLIFPWR